MPAISAAALKNAYDKRATKAVLLTRVSTVDQEQGYSLDAQNFRNTACATA